MQKKCFKCLEEKIISEFYKHPRMADGYLGKCKQWTKSDANEHRRENIEKIRAYDRERNGSDHRKSQKNKINRAWYAEDPRRKKAHAAVFNAVKKGKLIKHPCFRCGEEKSVAHHEDYDKPLDVVWLCQPCHKQRHKEIDAA